MRFFPAVIIRTYFPHLTVHARPASTSLPMRPHHLLSLPDPYLHQWESPLLIQERKLVLNAPEALWVFKRI